MRNSPEVSEFKVAVASTSPLKIRAVERACKVSFPYRDVTVSGFDIPSGIYAQPFGGETFLGALKRITTLRKQKSASGFNAYIAIESGIYRAGDRYVDLATVLIDNTQGQLSQMTSLPVEFPKEYVSRTRELGFAKHTVGSVLAEDLAQKFGFNQKVLAHDPHFIITGGRFSRESILFEAVEKALAAVCPGDDLPLYLSLADYRSDRSLIIGKFYGEEMQTVKGAAEAIENAGFDVYPNSSTPVNVIHPKKNGGDQFYFLGRKEDVKEPRSIQAEVFISMANLQESGKICYVAVHNGYVGESTGIELGYALLLGVPIVLSEGKITRFSDKVPPVIRFLIEKHVAKYPVVPVDKITHHSLLNAQRTARAVNPPKLTEEEYEVVTDAVTKLIDSLETNYYPLNYQQ